MKAARLYMNVFILITNLIHATLNEHVEWELLASSPSLLREQAQNHSFSWTLPSLKGRKILEWWSRDDFLAERMPNPWGRSLHGILNNVDDRTFCPDINYPFSAVGQLTMMLGNLSFQCSGALIGPDVVLTAAHCIYDRGTRSFFTSLLFTPGRYRGMNDGKDTSPFGSYTWSTVTIYNAFLDSNTANALDWDIAVVQLQSRIGDITGWMGIHSPDCTADTIPVSSPVTSFANQPSYGVLPSPIIISPPVSTYSTKHDSTPVAATDAISSIHLQLTGYPDTWPQGSCATEQCTTHIPQCMDPLLMHDCATSPGQSGSPMWRMEASSLNCTAWGAYIYAVHNAELENVTSTSETPISNCAVYITPLHFMSILSWIQESFNVLEQAKDVPMVPPGSPVAESDGATRKPKGSPSVSSNRFEAVVAGCALFPVHMVNASFQHQPLTATSSSCPQHFSLLLILQLPMFAVLLMYYTVSDW